MSGLPVNWAVVPLSEIALWSSGGTPSRSNPSYYGGTIPWIKTGDLGERYLKKVEEYITEDALKNSSAKLFPANAVAMAMYGATIGKTSILTFEAATNQACAVAVPNGATTAEFLYYLLLNEKEKFISKGKGGAQPNISQSIIKEHLVVLPPLNEQKRIADKLDSILAKVDGTQARLDKIPAILKRFRQSVLAAATSGELTREWRGNDVIVSTEIAGLFVPVEWQFCTVEDIGVVKGGKRLPKGDELTENNTGFPYIRAGQLKNGTVVQGDSARNRQMFLAPETQAQIKRYTVNEGDVYLTIVGASIGDAGIIPHALHQANLTENAAKITNFNEKISAQYLSIWLRSERLQELIQLEIKSGAQGKLALKRINTLPVPLPPIAEQHEIVSIVEMLLSRAETLDRSYQLVKSRVDRLAQSILAKAFRGELVDQNPSDEPADMLLERIKQQQREAPKATRQTRKPAAKVIPSVYVVETDVELTPPESEIFALLKNTRGELSAQQIMDKLTEKTFEQVDALFTELKRLLDNNAIVKVGSGEACTFKAIKR